jgi:hypothetical protein
MSGAAGASLSAATAGDAWGKEEVIDSCTIVISQSK